MTGFSESVDFVIVGSGGGSMCAALYAAAQGKKVVVLEKSEYYGGTTARSGGVMWIPDNAFMKRDGAQDSPEAARRYLEALAETFDDAPGATPERRERYLREAPQMVEFLLRQGIDLYRIPFWPDYNDELPGGCKTSRCLGAEPFNIKKLGSWQAKMRPGFLEMPMRLDEALAMPNFKRSAKARKIMLRVIGRVIFSLLTGRRYVSAGKALQARMLEAALKAGVEIRTQTPVEELVVENDKVVGVVTARGTLAAKYGVLVGAGGFAHNARMRQRYQPGTSTEWSSAPVDDTGEMIEIMQRHGAVVAQMEEMVGNPCLLTPANQYGEVKQGAQGVTAKPHAILVDQRGQRYMNEASSYMTYCQTMLAHNAEEASQGKAVPSWAVFDAQYLKKYMLAGTMPGSKKPQSWYDEGFLKKADTIEALATQIAVDPVALKNTVERFNGFVDKNRDEDFCRGERAYATWLGDALHQPSASLGRIECGPFYAVAVYPGDVGTYGGVITNEKAQVVRADGTVIKGLFATGVCTASVMGRAYAGAGSSVGPAFTFGYVAAQEALGAKTA